MQSELVGYCTPSASRNVYFIHVLDNFTIWRRVLYPVLWQNVVLNLKMYQYELYQSHGIKITKPLQSDNLIFKKALRCLLNVLKFERHWFKILQHGDLPRQQQFVQSLNFPDIWCLIGLYLIYWALRYNMSIFTLSIKDLQCVFTVFLWLPSAGSNVCWKTEYRMLVNLTLSNSSK